VSTEDERCQWGIEKFGHDEKALITCEIFKER
jgi:hypothetical protein